MRKIMLAACVYDEGTIHGANVKRIYETFTIPRITRWAVRHGFEFIKITENKTGRNTSWTKMFWLIENYSSLKCGDVVVGIDGDVCIVDGRYAPVFEKDFAVPIDSTGAYCTGFWSARISEWTFTFVKEMCSEERNKQNLSNENKGMWEMFREQEALYEVLGLKWDYPLGEYGERKSTPFSNEEIKAHFETLPVKWNVSFDPNDPKEGCCYFPWYKPERYWPRDQAIVRHFAAGTIEQQWALDYFKVPMI
jgi:hypothetical protein